MVQRLGLRASTARETGLSPTWGTKIPNAAWYSKKKKKKKNKKERKTRKNKRLQTYPISRHGSLRLVGGFAWWAYPLALRDCLYWMEPLFSLLKQRRLIHGGPLLQEERVQTRGLPECDCHIQEARFSPQLCPQGAAQQLVSPELRGASMQGTWIPEAPKFSRPVDQE